MPLILICLVLGLQSKAASAESVDCSPSTVACPCTQSDGQIACDTRAVISVFFVEGTDRPVVLQPDIDTLRALGGWHVKPDVTLWKVGRASSNDARLAALRRYLAEAGVEAAKISLVEREQTGSRRVSLTTTLPSAEIRFRDTKLPTPLGEIAARCSAGSLGRIPLPCLQHDSETFCDSTARLTLDLKVAGARMRPAEEHLLQLTYAAFPRTTLMVELGNDVFDSRQDTEAVRDYLQCMGVSPERTAFRRADWPAEPTRAWFTFRGDVNVQSGNMFAH